MTQPTFPVQILQPQITALHPNLRPFSPDIIEKVNTAWFNEILRFDKLYFRKYIELINETSVNDAKQIIYMWHLQNGNNINFYYMSYEEILNNLTLIIGGMDKPQIQLPEILRRKSESFLPLGLHEWFENDLPAMLFFAQYIYDMFPRKASIGGEEFTRIFMNFIQFLVIDFKNDTPIGNPLYSSLNNFNKQYYEQQFEDYKYWYLKYFFEKNKFERFDTCDDDQLDKCLKNLEQKGLRILKDIFYPKSKEDKISLIIASLNHISPAVIPIEKKLHNDTQTSLTLVRGNYEVVEYHSYIIFREDLFEQDYDKEKYVGFGLPFNRVNYIPGTSNLNYIPRLLNIWENLESLTFDFITPNGSQSSSSLERYYENDNYEKLNILLVGKMETKFVPGRDYYTSLLLGNFRQANTRSVKKLSKNDRTIKIYQKTMPILTELAKAEGMSIEKYVNHLIDRAK